MLEETLLHKGSAEEWNSVMINEHLPGKPLQHNLIFSILGLYRSTHAWQVRWRVEVTTMPVTSLVVYFIHYIQDKGSYCIHTYILDIYIQDEFPKRPREQTNLKSPSRLGKDGEW